MNIVVGYPPNIEKIKKAFNPPATVVFTYGNTIYSPGSPIIPDDLMVHEETHTKQQGNNPDAWWDKYIADPIFRLAQEVEAYQNQYRKFCALNKDRNIRVKFLYRIASDLSGPIYGNIIGMSEALSLIKK